LFDNLNRMESSMANTGNPGGGSTAGPGEDTGSTGQPGAPPAGGAGPAHPLEDDLQRTALAAAENVLASARAAAEEILAKARAAAEALRSNAPEARTVAEEILTSARTAAHEILVKARAAAEEILERTRTAEGLIHARAPEILARARALEEEILSRALVLEHAIRSRAPEIMSRARAMDRRTLLTIAGGGVIAAVLGERLLRSLRGKPPAPSAIDVTAARTAAVTDGTGVAFGTLGDYVYLTPTKLGGGAHAQDLLTGKTLAWIEYWNYGDSCPIAHHLAAYPSADPRKGFEFVNSTQGGDNILIYGLPTDIKAHGLLDPIWGQGNRIYRVHYDGAQMNLIEDISETTGLGLGVHTVIYPDGNGFAAADGQKDICAFFDRPPLPRISRDDKPVAQINVGPKTKALMAFRGDWIGRDSTGSLEANWFNGGKLRITRLIPAKETGLYDYRGSKGNKIDWEMVPMAESLVYTGQLPGNSPRTLCGLDAVVHHPANRFSALIVRMCSAAVILDRNTWEPVCCLHNPEGSPGNLPVKKVSKDPDVWEIDFPDIKCVGHEAGFSPSGNNFTMMNNIRQNNMAVFDTSDYDPRNWKKITFVKDPGWVGDFPSPFHLCFSMDRSKMFVSVLYPKPARSGVVVVDTATWKIIKKFENIAPDCQTMAVTYDGRYVLQIYSGFQRLESGVFIFTQDTLEPVGMMPNFGGHHDCVVVPTKTEHLVNSRCTTL
jgi:hypothetical protein